MSFEVRARTNEITLKELEQMILQKKKKELEQIIYERIMFKRIFKFDRKQVSVWISQLRKLTIG